eukprot:PhM_4_TR16419/c0_g1_i1/m.92608
MTKQLDPEKNPYTLAKINLYASASAGFCARLPLHPIDTAKARAMASQSATNESTFTVLRNIMKTEGIRGLYRGMVVSCVGSAPGVALYLSSYEYSKAQLATVIGDEAEGIVSHFLCGFTAEAISCVVWVPIDVLKERLQVQTPSLKGYEGSFDAFRTILHAEGVRGIYRGYLSTLATFGPTSALYFVFFEALGGGGDGTMNTLTRAFAANALAAGITSPLDMAKVRLQVQRTVFLRNGERELSKQFTYSYRGMINAVKSIIKQEGVRSLFRGAGSRIAYTAPNAALTMSLYDAFKVYYGECYTG